ncbi:TetR/AcrR family transcriptional regulator [Brachybacterium sp. NPDC056505]|uniref:TetR/AcrR family transcriptional regulator n=1 Tax=Brachybacterium sp. NPDC056505 TaxID=3345843 RepID=UPI003672D883
MSASPAPGASDRGARTRERLLVAAQELIWEQGVSATTPRQVWERSGTGQGSLYHHFPTKHALALAAVTRTVRQMLDGARASLAHDSEPEERVHDYLTRPRDAVAGCRVGRLTSDATVMADDELRAAVRGYFTQLLDLATVVFEEAGEPPEAARRRATTAVAVIQGGYVLSRALGDPAPMRDATEGLLQLLDIAD